MPEDKSSKTEAPSKHKLKQAREQGQVAKSQDLASTSSLTLAIVTIAVTMRNILKVLTSFLSNFITDFPMDEISEGGTHTIIISFFLNFIYVMGPILVVVWLTAFIATAAQVGLKVSFKPLEPKFDKINPVNGFQRLFSMRSVVNTLLGIFKMVFVSVVAGSVLYNNKDTITSLNLLDIQEILRSMSSLSWEVSIKASATLLILAVVDYAYQKWQFTQDQKMTKDEVKKEYKEQEGDPHIKGQIKSRQKAAAQKQGLQQAVAGADMVVTNPFHIAVAVKYDRQSDASAPMVVAKGARLLAQRIKEFAMEEGIEIIENIPVARALYKDCNVDQEITPELYIAVAEILAIVYQRRQEKQMSNNAQQLSNLKKYGNL